MFLGEKSMRDKILVSTSKGLFTATRGKSNWAITDVAFLGDNVTIALHDPRSGFSYAALDHGHFGVKMHRNKGDGWQEIATPAYPEKPTDVPSKDGWGAGGCRRPLLFRRLRPLPRWAGRSSG